MAYLEFRNIQLKYDQRLIFSGFNLAIERQEKVLFCAPSGRGKTSLVKMLLGFVIPDVGEISVAGVTLSGATVNQIRSKITYVSQDADLPKGRVSDVFADVFKYQVNRHLSYHEAVLSEWLTTMALPPDTLERDVDALSGGERQRLALILGILLDRDIWILDEITTGLDLELKTKIVELLLGYDKTILVVSHDEIYQNRGLREVNW
ncbi:ATP-binding cassette domain-containing protein [Acetobacterium wieringae]|uniref:ABC transporter ATP-binding protein n=1 Tax=Acetobacterium wieringae TaxID=52694 RepID=UPI0026EBD648|nr:ATP-binding cassette domain-containing protein [Acetobacterium wieringae]